MIGKLQQAGKKALKDSGKRSLVHPVWAGPGWKVFLNTTEDIIRIVDYIRQNPVKAGRPEQEWDFVKIFDGVT